MFIESRVIYVTLLLVFKSSSGADVDNEAPVVETSDGTVRGMIQYALDSSKPINAFLGIPFAQPPVGDLRFLKPQPSERWSGIKDATQFGSTCPQDYPPGVEDMYASFGLNMIPLNMSEDCLFLNIYSSSFTTRKPVLVWIHGGGFSAGTGAIYDGTALASFHDIVVVTINYRLGILGFLSTLDENAPGNAGLWDQVEALKWVQKNIAQFGGDPSQVTIVGESAGGVSVGFLVTSPVTDRLFRRAIPQSGTSVETPLTTADPLTNTNILAKELKCGSSIIKDTVQCLRRVKSEDLTSAVSKISKDVTWFPVKDSEIVPDTSLNLYKKKEVEHVDLMVGVNTQEGFLLTNFLAPNIAEYKTKKDFSTNMNQIFYSFGGQKFPDKLMESLTDFYLGSDNKLKGDYLHQKFVDCLGDWMLAIPSLRKAKLHAELKAKTYLYVFQHRPSFSTKPKWILADHAEDLAFSLGLIFTNMHGDAQAFTDEDKKMSRIFMKYISNFIHNGNPNSDDLTFWPEHNADKREFLKLNVKPEDGNKFNEERFKFWTEQVPPYETMGSKHDEL